MATFREREEQLKSELVGEARYVDVALNLTRNKTGETLLRAGGEWDRLDRRFTRRTPSRVVEVGLEESQVEFTRWFEEFLRDFREGFPRQISLSILGGDRRGGKTFNAYFCQIAALIDVPLLPSGLSVIGWTISRTYRERDELDQLVHGYLPDRLYRHQRAPEHRFIFPHGSYLRNLSADDPEALKQGQVDFLLYNEPQKMSPRAIKNGMYGTADRGGLTVLATNPPSPGQAEWLIDLKEAIEEDPEIRPIAKFFGVSSKDNSKIDQPARRRVGKLAAKIDPEGLAADEAGKWERWGDLAYPSWNPRALDRGGLVGPPPEVGAAVDATERVVGALFGRYKFIVGGDFQRRPQAAAVLKVYEVNGELVYWFVDECGVKGTEVELSVELMGRDFRGEVLSPETGVWIADCSGSYQGAERIPGRTSFQLLREQGWRVEPAEVVRIPEKHDHPKNPDVMQRLGLMQRLMEKRRIRVDPRCTWLIEAFSKCQLRKTEYGRRVPKGVWAHVTDAACYPIWRLEPKPTPRGGPRRDAAGVVTLPRPDRGIKLL